MYWGCCGLHAYGKIALIPYIFKGSERYNQHRLTPIAPSICQIGVPEAGDGPVVLRRPPPPSVTSDFSAGRR